VAPVSAETSGGPLPRILVFYDYACPFCYVDQYRFDQLKTEHDVEIVLVPFELRPRMPTAGVSAREHGLGHSERVEQFLLNLAEQGGFPMSLPDAIPNTHLAIVMGEVARDRGGEVHERVHRGVFDAYFGRGLDIGKEEVLLAEAAGLGLDVDKVAEAWLTDEYEQRIRGFRNVAIAIGVTATPAALVCNELLIGSRPYGIIRDAVERCLVTPDTAAMAEQEHHA
jgi:predicted DsbA family dithiol-disulfide isomerase